MDNLGDIVTFVRVVASGSFVSAANQLGVTPSAVSKSVSRLEESLGIRLLNRTTRSLSPTDVGSAFYARCQALITQLQDAEAEVVETRQRPRGRLRVDMPLTLAREYVIPALPRFLAQFPDVTLQLSFSDRLVDMVNEAIDIAVRVGELTDSRLVARRLWNPDVVAIASPDYLARRGDAAGSGRSQGSRLHSVLQSEHRTHPRMGHGPRRSTEADLSERTRAGRQP